MTIGDKIRKMSNEELAEKFAEIFSKALEAITGFKSYDKEAGKINLEEIFNQEEEEEIDMNKNEYAVTLIEKDRIVAVGTMKQVAAYLGKNENAIRAAVSRRSIVNKKYKVEKC